jgi:hypothetical protein
MICGVAVEVEVHIAAAASEAAFKTLAINHLCTISALGLWENRLLERITTILF